MTDAPVDLPDDSAPQRSGRRSHGAVIALAIVTGLMVLAVVVWARFLSGASAAPVPELITDYTPALAGSSSAIEPSPAPSAATSPAPSAGRAAAPVQPQSTTAVVPQLASSSSVEPQVDASWLDRMSAATGISRRALQAYAGAELELEREKPACRIGWATLAGIGKIESNNGRTLSDAGYSTSPILGPVVQGSLHAQGPMQFMPSTWAKWGADGNGDGVADPNQIDDAALAAARYLCSYGDLETSAGWHAAVFGYNHLDSYVASVAAQATLYAQRGAKVDARS